MEVDSPIESADSPLNNTDSEISETSEVKQSNTPKPVPILTPRKQPELLCSCPLQCNNKVDKEWRKIIYRQFHDTCDHPYQNQFIQRHIKIKSIAQRLWEDETVDKRVQRRVTCKYLIPTTDSVKKSYHYAKTLTYDSTKNALDTSPCQKNGYKLDCSNEIRASATINSDKTNGVDSCHSNDGSNKSTTEPSPPEVNGNLNDSSADKLSDTSQKENISNVNSPSSLNDNESVNTIDDGNSSDDSNIPTSVKYVEVCQKAFMNMYGITEKRIRWQREKLILKSRILAAKKRKELEEMDRTLSLARSLGAGCKPLYEMLEKSNCTHLSEQLMGAIEDDVALVNNFFHNQLWKPEDIMNKSIYFSNVDSFETECD